MNLIESFRTALTTLAARRQRSALTVLGIVIGVGAVISLMSVGAGASQMVTSQITSMGSNLVFVSPGSSNVGGISAGAGSAATLTLQDAQAIAENVPEALMVAAQTQTVGQVVAGSQNTRTRVLGTTPDYQFVRNSAIADGDFISQTDIQANSTVAVLGSNVAETLFQGADPIGSTVKINSRPFRVIGVLASKGGGALGTEDDMVIIPITTMTRLTRQRTVSGGLAIQQMSIQVDSEKNIETAKLNITDLLRERHRLTTDQNDFTITSQQDIIQTATQVTGVLTILLGAIAGISLLVGGIGIMNIMLVSVTERIREIGLRKAVGAKRRDILTQFMIEAVVLSLFGGALGLALGWALSRAISAVPINGQNIPAAITPEIILLAVGVSSAIGVFFGIYPAYQASRLDPIEALRHE